MSSAPTPFFVAGGTVPPGSASYVERAADRELYDALLAGEFCFVLNSRQMGKSSLAVRTIGRLEAEGVRCAFVDLTRVGGATVTPEQWYAGLLLETGRALGLRAEAAVWLKEHRDVGPAQRFLSFLHESALARIETPVVLLVDEIDAVRSLGFSTDELFAGIRQLHNGRASDPALRRLTVCLLGAALPSDLIRDPRTTPFNVGRRVELRDFLAEEARPFAGQVGEPALARVLYWTNGHPFLTQALCAEIAPEMVPLEAAAEVPQGPVIDRAGGRGNRGGGGGGVRREHSVTAVDALVRARYLDARARDTDTNLTDVGRRLLGEADPNVDDAARADTLSLYERVLRGKPVPDDEANPAAARIKMSGVARVESGLLKPRNRIYAAAFDARWVHENMPGQELRRQRRAFWRGALRTGLVSAVVLAVVSALSVVAMNGARRARLAETEAGRQREEALAQRNEAQTQRDAARMAQRAAVRSAILAETRRKEAESAKGAAQHSAADARLAAARALTAQRRETVAKGLAQRSSAVATLERNAARAANRVLQDQLYDNTIASLQATWESGNRLEVADLIKATMSHPRKGWEWGYWKGTSHAVVDQRGLDRDFETLWTNRAFVPSEGDKVIVAGNFTGLLIDGRSGRIRRRLWQVRQAPGEDGHMRPVFSANGRWAITRGAGMWWTLRDLERGTERPLYPAVPKEPQGENTTYSTILGVTDDGSRYVTIPDSVQRRPFKITPGPVEVRDGRTDRLLLTRFLKGHVLALSPDARSILLAGGEAGSPGALTEYELGRGSVTARYELPLGAGANPENILARYAPKGRIMVVATGGGAVFRSGGTKPEATFALAKDTVVEYDATVSASADASRLAVGTELSTCVFDARTGELLAKHPSPYGRLSQDGRLLWAAQPGGVAAVDWSATRSSRTTQLGPPKSYMDYYRSLQRDGTSVIFPDRSAVGKGERGILLFDAEGRSRGRYPKVGGLAAGESATLAGPFLAVRGGKGAIRLLRVPDLQPAGVIPPLSNPPTSLSRDGRRGASVDERGLLHLWEKGVGGRTIATGFVVERPFSFSRPNRPSIAGDGTKVVLVGQEGDHGGDMAKVWDFRTGQVLATSPKGLMIFHWGPTSGSLYFEIGRGGLNRLDLDTKALSPVVPPSAGFFYDFAFSPDGRLAALCPESNVVQVWSLVGKPRRLFTLDSARIGGSGFTQAFFTALAFSPDGRSLALLYGDNLLRTFHADF